MQRILLIAALFAFSTTNAQFKNDNVTYKTVFPEDLCKTLQANPGYVILDVRSQGEYDDTSQSVGLNIGHIKDSKHISIQELPARWKELLEYKDTPLFIYCSHSQRSRRASRLLADSGFTKVFNINGGLTNFYDDPSRLPTCTEYLITQNIPYKIVSPAAMIEKIRKGTSYTVVDIREDSVFGTSARESKKLQGHFDAAIRIPFSKFSEGWSKIPKNKPVIITDEFGNESPKAARMLVQNGYTDVSILFNGMFEWMEYVYNNAKEKLPIKWTSGINYNIINDMDFNKLMTLKRRYPVVLLDVRSKEEFNNSSKNYWQNIGHIQTAKNIPSSELTATSEGLPPKNIAIVLYGFNSQDEIFQAARKLKDMGYTNVSVLLGGIWNLRWASHNLKGKAMLNELVVDVPAENL